MTATGAMDTQKKETSCDWEEVRDEETNKVYYYNRKTEETSWEPPTEAYEPLEGTPPKSPGHWVEYKDETNGEPYYFHTGTQETSWEKPPDLEEPKENWIELKDDTGKAYYYNEATEETSWDRPKNLPPKEDKHDESLGDGWVELKDDQGQTYYYNENTDETSWERPQEESKDAKSSTSEPKESPKESNDAKSPTTAPKESPKESSDAKSPVPEPKESPKESEDPKSPSAAPKESPKESEESPDDAPKDTAKKSADQDWVELQDDDGKTYYYNETTQETSWEKPETKGSPSKTTNQWVELQDEQGRTYYYNETTEETTWERPADFGTEGPKKEQWVELQDDDGKTYYYNESTQETTWDPPDGFTKEDTSMSPVRPQSPEPEAMQAGDWTRYEDDEGRFYYYNDKTQETVWDKPPGFEDTTDPTIIEEKSPEKASPMEVEEEEVVDPAVQRLEKAKEALSQPDAILETGILTDLTEVVKSDLGNPKNAIQALSESSHGQTAVCGLLGRWLADLKSQTSSQAPSDPAVQAKEFQKSADGIREMTQEVVHRIVKERFTHKGGDNILALSKSEAAFLEDMMDSNRWRKLLIDLSAANKDSALLMYCLQSISKRGHHREIARRINQSEHFPVFNAMLASELAVIGKISVSSCHDHDTSIPLNELVGDLRRICTSTSYTYLYGFEVLRFQIQKAKHDALGMVEKDRLLYQRVIRKWERLLEVLQGDMIDPSNSTESTPLFRKRRLDVACTISDLHQRQRRRLHPDKEATSTPSESSTLSDSRKNEIESAILAFLRKYCLCTPLDDSILDKMLPSPSSDETKFVGNLLVKYPITIEALLGYLYKPGQRVGRETLKKKCARLTALSVMVAEEESLEEAKKIDPKVSNLEPIEEENLSEQLLGGSQLCEQLENMVSFIVTTEATPDKTSPGERLCSLAVRCAPVAQGVAMWAREITRGGEFVTSASYASISPNIMTLVRIVYMHHPFTRDDVCSVAFQFLKHSNSEVVYHTMNTLKEQSLRLLLFLCTRGEAPIIFDQFMGLLKDPGRSGLDASLIRYFLSGLLQIAKPPFSIPFIRSFMVLLKAPATVDALKTSYFDKESQKRLGSIMNYLKTRTSGKLDARPMAKEDVSLIHSVLSIYGSVPV